MVVVNVVEDSPVVAVVDDSPVVAVVDDSPVVAVSILDFLGEGSQPFSVGRERFWECPVTIVSSRGKGTSSVISVSAVPNLKLQVLPTLSAASKCSIMVCSPLFKRLFGNKF